MAPRQPLNVAQPWFKITTFLKPKNEFIYSPAVVVLIDKLMCEVMSIVPSYLKIQDVHVKKIPYNANRLQWKSFTVA